MVRLLKREFALLVSIALVCATLSATRDLSAETPTLRVGAAKLEITPEPKFYTELSGVTGKPFQGVHDPIYARALVLDNGVTSAAILELDLAEYGDTTSLRQRIAKELAIPADHIILAATHDHSAPRAGVPTPGTSSMQGRPKTSLAYNKVIEDDVLEVLRQAKASLQPARIGVGTGKVTINIYRYSYGARGWGSGTDEAGYTDPNVWVLKFETLSGTPIAILMNYAVHSNSMAGEPGNLVTGDIAGMAETYVERHYQNKAIALFSMGAAADQYPKFNWDKTDAASRFEPIEMQGGMLGAEVLQVADSIQKLSETATIHASERAVPCEMRPQTAPTGNAGGPPNGGPPNGGPPMAQQPMPPLTPGQTLDMHLSLIRINDLAITSVSGEVFTGIYEHLKRESPFKQTMMITLANDRDGYIPDEASWDRAGAAFVRGCAEAAIVNNLVEMMKATMQ